MFDNSGLPKGRYDLSKVVSFQSIRDMVNGFPKITKDGYDYGNVWLLPETKKDTLYNAFLAAASHIPYGQIPAALAHLCNAHMLDPISQRLNETLENEASGKSLQYNSYDAESKNNPQKLSQIFREKSQKFKRHQVNRIQSAMEKSKHAANFQVEKFGFVEKPVKTSNWSFFEAVQDQLKNKKVYKMNSKSLVLATVQQMQNNKSAYEKQESEPKIDLSSYCKKLLDKQEAPTQAAMRALSKELGLTITIIKSGETSPLVFKPQKSHATLYLGEKKGQYTSLVPGLNKKPQWNIASVIQSAQYDS